MKVAVTGATGFIGRHVVPGLLARGLRVVATTRAAERDYAQNRNLTTVPMDVADAGDAFVRLGEPDVLLHLAWGGLPNYQSSDHLEVELPRQIAFLNSCVRAGLKRLVVAGTCLEYGMLSGCLDESLATAPVTAYGSAKDHLRTHLQSLASDSGLQLTWIRMFYLYGLGQASTSLYSQFRAAIASGAMEFPMSPGDQLRDFLPVETAATQLIDVAVNAPGAGIVNLCSGAPKTVASLVREWMHSFGADLRLNLGAFPYPDYEPHSFWGNTRKLNALLGTT